MPSLIVPVLIATASRSWQWVFHPSLKAPSIKTSVERSTHGFGSTVAEMIRVDLLQHVGRGTQQVRNLQWVDAYIQHLGANKVPQLPEGRDLGRP